MGNKTDTSHLKGLARLFALLCLPGSMLQADFISGQVVDANGVGVSGVDIDIDNLGSGGDPTILNDGTDANGFFITTVPAGFYRVLFLPPAPPASTHLTAILDNVLVTDTTDMGVITLPAGIGLTGRVMNGSGFPVANVNLDAPESGAHLRATRRLRRHAHRRRARRFSLSAEERLRRGESHAHAAAGPSCQWWGRADPPPAVRRDSCPCS